MAKNVFDYFEQLPTRDGTQSPWAARTPRRPRRDFDLLLFPRSPGWESDADSLLTLEQIRSEPWVAELRREGGAVQVRLADGWMETTGAALEAGGSSEELLADLAEERRFSVQFWDSNATKALHIGHLRNLSLGNALAAALTQAGGRVERRSRISDMGRAMGEAMAGVMSTGRHAEGWPEGDEKSDHFVGACYAEYVASGGSLMSDLEQAEDSLSREVQVQNDAADELIKRVLEGEREALALWSQTRSWVIAGQRKTLARLGISFDRVLFESDFLHETAQIAEEGLRDGVLTRRSDGVVVYRTGFEELEEVPLVRADGLSTQHMRSLTYSMTAPDLEGITSLQITGSEWVSHLASIKKLSAQLRPGLNGDFHPSRSIFHGMVSQQKRALTSSAGALLIDELIDWLDRQLAAEQSMRDVRRAHPSPERIPAQIALGYFLLHPVGADVDFDPGKLLQTDESLGWALAQARAHHSSRPGRRRPVEDPDYRFAVVQSELYRRHLRQSIEKLDVTPIAQYLKHLAVWYMEQDRDEAVTRVVHTLIDRGARGLGLESAS